MSDDRITLQWRPSDGPPRKLSLKPTDDGWQLISKCWDGQEWDEISFELVDQPSVYAPTQETNTEQTPPTLESLRDEIQHTWQTDDPNGLIFDSADIAAPIVVVDRNESLYYYSDNLESCQPVTQWGLRGFVRKFGLPSVRSLSATPHTQEDFARGGFHA